MSGDAERLAFDLAPKAPVHTRVEAARQNGAAQYVATLLELRQPSTDVYEAWQELTPLLQTLRERPRVIVRESFAALHGRQPQRISDVKRTQSGQLQSLLRQASQCAEVIVQNCGAHNTIEADSQTLSSGLTHAHYPGLLRVDGANFRHEITSWLDAVVANVPAGAGRTMLGLVVLPEVFRVMRTYSEQHIYYATNDLVEHCLERLGMEEQDSRLVQQVMMGALYPSITAMHEYEPLTN